jgi:hypothetical protein
MAAQHKLIMSCRAQAVGELQSTSASAEDRQHMVAILQRMHEQDGAQQQLMLLPDPLLPHDDGASGVLATAAKGAVGRRWLGGGGGGGSEAESSDEGQDEDEDIDMLGMGGDSSEEGGSEDGEAASVAAGIPGPIAAAFAQILSEETLSRLKCKVRSRSAVHLIIQLFG